MTRNEAYKIHLRLCDGELVSLHESVWDEYEVWVLQGIVASVKEKESVGLLGIVSPKPCPDCKGTGAYRGFNVTEPCKTCRPVL